MLFKLRLSRFMAYEARFRGATPEMIKWLYISNFDFVSNSGVDAAAEIQVDLVVAFSRFSNTITNGYLLICDIGREWMRRTRWTSRICSFIALLNISVSAKQIWETLAL